MLLVPQLLCLLGLALGTVHAAPSADEVKLERGSCPPFWFTFDGRCYNYVASRLNWQDAEFNCLDHEDSNLVSIHSDEENNFVQSLIQNFDPMKGFTWIGMSDVHREGRWMWSDGSRVRYTRWGYGELNGGGGENCAFTNHGTEWGDHNCGNTFPSVCEFSFCQ